MAVKELKRVEGLGSGILSPIVENQMEKNMEH